MSGKRKKVLAGPSPRGVGVQGWVLMAAGPGWHPNTDKNNTGKLIHLWPVLTPQDRVLGVLWVVVGGGPGGVIGGLCSI